MPVMVKEKLVLPRKAVNRPKTEYSGERGAKREIQIINELAYSAETLAAMQETLDIMDGKIKVKSYATVEEMNADIDAEEDD